MRSFLIILICLFMSPIVTASVLTSIGNTYEIKEVSLLEVLYQKLNELDANGDISKIQNEMTSNSQKYLQRPTGIFLPKTLKNKTHYFDPSIVLTEDLYLQDGTLLHTKGTKLNPLLIRGLSKKIIFIDGDDKEQLEYAFKLFKQSSWLDKVVLIRGDFLKILTEWERPIYFDQLGISGQNKLTLREKFNIQSVPSVVYQDGNLLRIDAVALGENQ